MGRGPAPTDLPGVTASTASAAGGPTGVQVLRALVVDDNAWTLRALTEKLAASGAIHVVGWASSGADALVRADQFVPDFVLLDYQLGDMTGLDVARRLKRAP